LKKAKRHLKDVVEARKIAVAIASEIERKVHSQIGHIVSICLSEIFGGVYQFKLDFTKKANRTQVQLILMKDGHEVGNVLDNDSGGVADVCGFAMRLACIMIEKPQKRKLLVLDEPFKNLHGQVYRERLRILLQKLSEEFGVQIVMVTGVWDFQIGKVVKI
jgi:ABC-type molybdenum transport system ATPase subunit/photorepair protein PhrA